MNRIEHDPTATEDAPCDICHKDPYDCQCPESELEAHYGAKKKDHTAAARNARLREKKRAEGLVPVTVMVPVTRREDLKAIAAEMRKEAATDTDN